MSDFRRMFGVAESAAREAGQLIRSQCGSDVVVNESHHHDLKIQLDVETQQLLEKRILEAFPNHAILGEEGGSGSGGSGAEWILDPIDGTVNLAYGLPHFCVSIAFRQEGVTQVGVVYDPMRDECFSATKGGGAMCNGRAIRASRRERLDEGILALGFSKSAESVEKCLELYQFYGRRARKLRAMGSAALDMAYIAAGRMDAYIEQGIKIWDIAAGQLLLEEAGGRVVLTPRDEPHHYHIKAWNGVMDLPMT
ncbi:MAG: inositol monophosphatase family protein [Candidatus Methylacidiphilales bacterium]|nr:inositol monophosphatase family protein [Candidatus Methylacidiphilales bacterium]